MRRHSFRVLAPAGLAAAALLAFSPAAFAEDVLDEASHSDGQAPVSGEADAKPAAKILHSIPEDDLPLQNAKGPDSPLIRQLIAARPDEDIVICVAGCFSGRDRVVYAQPVDRNAKKPVASLDERPADPIKQASLFTPPSSEVSIAAGTPATEASVDPKAPTIINAEAGGASTR